MSRKLSFLFTFLLVAFAGYAQEGDPIDPEEKIERPIILENEMDSAYSNLLPRETQIRSEKRSSIKLNSAFLPVGENLGIERVEKDEPKKPTYNFLYYLFYKFRKVDNADD